MTEGDNTDRQGAIRIEATNLLPILRPTTLTRLDAEVVLYEEDTKRQETVREIRELLSPVEAVLHATYQDRREHENDLLNLNKNKLVSRISLSLSNQITFAIGSPQDRKMYYVGMKGQKIDTGNRRQKQKNDQNIYHGCQEAIFCKSTPDQVRHFMQNSMKYATINGQRCIYGLPQSYEDISGFLFDFGGRINTIDSFDPLNEQGLIRYNLSYKGFLSQNGFSVHNWKRNIQYVQSGEDFYRKLENGDLSQIPIQGEIEQILNKLPFETTE